MLSLPGKQEVLIEASRSHRQTRSGSQPFSAVQPSPVNNWLEKVPAVDAPGIPEEGGRALADVLFGD